MKKFVVMTSIYPPSVAVQAFSKISDFNLVVVGDKKTSKDWSHSNVEFLSIEDQSQMDSELAKILPYNHYSRKMLGYLSSIYKGADVIVDTDDDNIPNVDWAFPPFIDQFEIVKNKSGFVNIYQLFTKLNIWPRGLPLNLINKKYDLDRSIEKGLANIGIWQGLADEDPDVDAIYRLTSDIPCIFQKRDPVVLDKGIISPFNSQCTMFRKELFALLYLPAFVTFRFTDILRGLVAQPIMWLYDFQLGFTDAIVVQKRNPHDYMKDFVSEIPMYMYSEKVIEIVTANISGKLGLLDNLFNAYEGLHRSKIVEQRELSTLSAWLRDVSDSSGTPAQFNKNPL